VIGLDTNVLVRYLAQDDPAQSAAATRLLDGFTAEAPGFISIVTLVETAWVLARAYRTPQPGIAAIIERLLRARELVVEQSETHYLALGIYQRPRPTMPTLSSPRRAGAPAATRP